MRSRRRLPTVGTGNSIFQFLHIDDAAHATLAALTHGEGHYDIADDDPAPTRVWLPFLAQTLSAKPLRHAPVWLAKLFGADGAASPTIEVPATSNKRAKAVLPR